MKSKVIGIVGFIGSGKNTVGQILIDEFDYVAVSFADSLKDACSAVFNWPRAMLEGNTDLSRHFREKVDPWWSKRLDIKEFTPRYALQFIGTDVMRNHFHRDIWLACVERKVEYLLENNKQIVITDVRFKNEVDLIKQLNGEIWHVQRENPKWYAEFLTMENKTLAEKEAFLVNLGAHPSEYDWLITSKFDHIIQNTGNLDQLRQSLLFIAK